MTAIARTARERQSLPPVLYLSVMLTGYRSCPNPDCYGSLDEDGRCPICGATVDDSSTADDAEGGAESIDREREDDLDGIAAIGEPPGAVLADDSVPALLDDSESVLRDGSMGSDWTTEIDLAERRPCPDGACIGVIGPDGRCTECGLVADDLSEGGDDEGRGVPSGDLGPWDEDEWGSEGEGFDEGFDDEAADEIDDDIDDEVASGEWYADGEEDDADGFDEDRTLCPDGACIGIIGPDGRCTECGRLAAEIMAEGEK